MSTGGPNGSDGGGGGVGGNGTDLAGGGPPPDMMLPSTNNSIVQYHNHPSHDGVYLQPTLTPTTAAKMHRDTSFDGTVVGNVYAAPLYVENGPNGAGAFIVATESNNIYALDETGKPLWGGAKHIVGPGQAANTASPQNSGASCGNIGPIGITGTPFIDLQRRNIYFVAVTNAGNDTVGSQYAHALSIDDGSERAGWPVDLNGLQATPNMLNQMNPNFDPVTQNQRGALNLVNGTLFIPFGGHWGDCDTYFGWLMGIQVDQPTSKSGFATGAECGIWATGGVSSDGASAFVTSGNGASQSFDWSDTIFRFTAGPFAATPTDYWTPTNWHDLDFGGPTTGGTGDLDLGGSAPVLIDVPGATPSQLLVQVGKDGNAYLVDRTNLGINMPPVDSKHIIGGEIIHTVAVANTPDGTFVAVDGYQGAQGINCNNGSGDLVVFQISHASPPQIVGPVWCANAEGQGSPAITVTDDNGSNAIVWLAGADLTQRLHGWLLKDGTPVFTGGGQGDQMTKIQYFQSPIAVKGRIFVAANNHLYAFTAP